MYTPKLNEKLMNKPRLDGWQGTCDPHSDPDVGDEVEKAASGDKKFKIRFEPIKTPRRLSSRRRGQTSHSQSLPQSFSPSSLSSLRTEPPPSTTPIHPKPPQTTIPIRHHPPAKPPPSHPKAAAHCQPRNNPNATIPKADSALLPQTANERGADSTTFASFPRDWVGRVCFALRCGSRPARPITQATFSRRRLRLCSGGGDNACTRRQGTMREERSQRWLFVVVRNFPVNITARR